MSKPVLCLDFDGVINSYTSGWTGADRIIDPPTNGFVAFLVVADQYFRVAIFSSRTGQPGGLQAMQDYLWKAISEHFDVVFAGNPDDLNRAADLFDRLEWPTEKPPAMVSIDDRALTFTGDWNDFDPKKLRDFQPWNKQPKPGSSGWTAIARHRTHPIRRFLTALMRALSAPS